MTIQHGLTIPWDAADSITLTNLKDHLEFLEQELIAHENEKSYMHPEDIENSKNVIIPALKVIIDYYSGPNDE